MRIEQRSWTPDAGWKPFGKEKVKSADLVLIFGANGVVNDAKRFAEVAKAFPGARIVSGSTAGEILGTTVRDGTISLTAVSFDKTRVDAVETGVQVDKDGEIAGRGLAERLPKEGLVHAMVFSDGLHVNGTALVKGLLSALPPDVSVTGGLVGGGDAFEHTYVGLDHVAEEGKIVLVGFYGSALKVGYGSLGGWDAFGPERLITKSKGNVLYEIDGKPALALYKEYLGEKASELPGSGLLFPLKLQMPEGSENADVVRTLLAVDEKGQSMTFAGDMPMGVRARLMKANFERLIDGAAGAGSMSVEPLGSEEPELAVLVSCIGRKLVLKERVEEEVEAVQERLGKGVRITGFYSYGEICPTAPTKRQCQMHNQTMTITTFREAA